MAYTNYPSTGSSDDQPQRPKDNRNLIYGVLIVIILGLSGYLIYSQSKNNQVSQQKDSQITTVTNEKDSLDNQFKMASMRMDSLTGNNAQLQGKLSDRESEINKLKEEYQTESKKDHADKNKLQSLINQLNGKINDYETQIAQLKAENETLTTNNQQLTVQRDSLTTQTQTLSTNLATSDSEKAQVTDVASTLHASNINIAAIDVRGSKEKMTTTAKKADMFRVSFDLDENRIAPSGEKELYVVVTSPDGKPITVPSNGSGEFSTRDEGSKVYTSKVDVNYEQGKRTPVSFDWKQESKYQAGNYKIEIYHNGYKIGEGTKSLKKGGLFS